MAVGLRHHCCPDARVARHALHWPGSCGEHGQAEEPACTGPAARRQNGRCRTAAEARGHHTLPLQHPAQATNGRQPRRAGDAPARHRGALSSQPAIRHECCLDFVLQAQKLPIKADHALVTSPAGEVAAGLLQLCSGATCSDRNACGAGMQPTAELWLAAELAVAGQQAAEGATEPGATGRGQRRAQDCVRPQPALRSHGGRHHQLLLRLRRGRRCATRHHRR